MIKLPGKFCNSLSTYSRFVTREVAIGDIPMGGNNPIRIQSMTTTDTMDTIGTVEQTIRMVEAGCEYVRITAPSIKEAQNLAEIKKQLLVRGFNVPLVADIHFTPNAAELAARIVEKVRVNPGNYADKKKFEIIDYSEKSYFDELERIRKRFTPLVKICKEYGTAIRIGTNHGSLSDRIMSHYGDTPKGMVESAMEFIRICEENNYYNLVISMKASNPQVMVQAYRLLVETMVSENMNYPLHLGVTEAGDGEDGRIKSAVGIGTLLEDGLGDTIRVSLTEEPEMEAPVAIALAKRYENKKVIKVQDDVVKFPEVYHPYIYQRRVSNAVSNIGGHAVPVVFANLKALNLKDPLILNAVGYTYSALLDKYNISDMAADFAFMDNQLPSFNFPGNLRQVFNYETWLALKNKNNCFPIMQLSDYLSDNEKDEHLNFINVSINEFNLKELNKCRENKNLVLILRGSELNTVADYRKIVIQLIENEIKFPIIFKKEYTEIRNDDEFLLHSSTDIGALLVDGFGDGIWIESPSQTQKNLNSAIFGILQATRTRISKTEYISCPSCGRTLFDLMETTQLIRSRTDHLKGIKIGIMGCIVNGPGEMADADYGYVGTGPGKITLYRGKEVVRKNINSESAVDQLIELIQEDGNWVELVGVME